MSEHDTRDDLDQEQIRKDFHEVVNMTPRELAAWLGTDESRSVGWTRDGETESVGHGSGERIVGIMKNKQADLSEDDYLHMRKVVGYVHRHLKQGGPADDRAQSRWRYSLMNWGHDPMKGEA